jgi:hypothetical protein
MTPSLARQCLVAVASFSALALVAACSGSPVSGSLSPTAPSAGLRSSIGDGTFSPNPNTPPPDPCEPAAFAGFNTSPNTPPPPPEPVPVLCGRFTGGGFSIDENEVRVSQGFTLHCDAMLSNNFEVNWAGGNNFHIDKNPTDVKCFLIDDPNPPDAPVNRIEINGTGTLNNAPATVTLVLIDNGEKSGAPQDQVYIAINGTPITGGTFAVPTDIDGGNIQAHFDQPHKN